MAATILNIREIVSDPTIRSGRPLIAGTGICVSDIVAYHLHDDKLLPEEIAAAYHLNLGQIHAALAYYYLHQAEIDQEMQNNADEARQLIAELERQGKAQSLVKSL